MAWQQRVPVHILTRDIFSITKVPSYTGLISNFGILTWCFSWAICTFTFFLIKPRHNLDKQIKNFIGLSGLISLWLMLDDLLMLHEQWLPYLLRISEDIVIVAELIWVIFHLIYFRKIILKFTQFKILALALLLFIVSIFLDFLPIKIDYIGFKSDWFFLLEDGSKLMGIITWCFYFCGVCYQQLIKYSNPI
ncbi:hypothetical protein [Planktothrix serta]|uniref:hypothetical protein n=1 Tax=Planktothrix serta TaxID=1678310 RepID=UPI0012DE99C9|nr:hypothetical protein [Planktothrix serta]